MAKREFDPELMEIAVKRRDALTALSEGPKHRKELQEDLDASKTTCHRIIRRFDNRGLLRRSDQGYTLSTKGELVATHTEQYLDRLQAACTLEPLVVAFEDTPFEFDIEYFVDATVTAPDPNDPTRPIHREFQIFKDSSSHRKVDTTQFLPPLYFEQLAEIILESGMRFEHVVSKEIVDQLISQFPDLHRKQRRGEIEARASYRIYEEVPFGLVIYDRSHVVVRTYDDDTGSIKLMVDTDEPEAVEWAEAVYAHYREESRPPDEVEGLPEWTPHPDLDI